MRGLKEYPVIPRQCLPPECNQNVVSPQSMDSQPVDGSLLETQVEVFRVTLLRLLQHCIISPPSLELHVIQHKKNRVWREMNACARRLLLLLSHSSPNRSLAPSPALRGATSDKRVDGYRIPCQTCNRSVRQNDPPSS